jgi:predicted permease
MPLPLFLLSVSLPWPAATVTIAAFGFFSPLVNAPILGLLTVRTPAALRPKVLTAVMTVASLVSPLGFVCAGLLLRSISISTLFLVLPALLTLGGLAFASILLRNRAAPDLAPVPNVAHG